MGRSGRGHAGDRLAGPSVRSARTAPRRTRTHASRSPRKRNPGYSPLAEDPRGVPISALVFGGRRREVAPLVYEARNWQHGVLVGRLGRLGDHRRRGRAQVGVVRRDPMAMQPFCGYNFARLLAALARCRREARAPPAIFHVNWFRQRCAGKFLWPGYGENLRVLEWMLDRCAGKRRRASSRPIGLLPRAGRPRHAGSAISGASALRRCSRCRPGAWRKEVDATSART